MRTHLLANHPRRADRDRAVDDDETREELFPIIQHVVDERFRIWESDVHPFIRGAVRNDGLAALGWIVDYDLSSLIKDIVEGTSHFAVADKEIRHALCCVVRGALVIVWPLAEACCPR